MIYNIDCVEGCKKYIESGSVDLVLADPPYGIDFSAKHSTYNRDSTLVMGNYKDIPAYMYADWCKPWMLQISRILKHDGSAYIFSGWSNLHHILNAINAFGFEIINHIIWKYQFGVYCTKKYVSSHYHILYIAHPKANRCFNIGTDTKENYAYLEDVFNIKRQYQKGETKISTQLPEDLVKKLILISSNEGDTIVDLFAGSGIVDRIARQLGRECTSFEIDPSTFERLSR